jgi:phage shock protein A
MATKQNKNIELLEIKNLIINLQQSLGTKVDALETKVDALETKVDHLNTKIDALETRVGTLDTKIDTVDKRLIIVETKVDSTNQRLSTIDTSIQKIPELTEKFGELKNWRQIALLVITAAVGVIGTTIGWLLRDSKL